MRRAFLIAILIVTGGVWAGQPVTGDEITGEAFVTWKAAIDRVTPSGTDAYNVKAKLEFQGHTREGNQIRGTGKLRFVGEPNELFAVGDSIRGSDSLRYWSTVTSVMGEDLAMIQGTGMLSFATTDSVLTTEGAIEMKAALEIY